MDAQPHVFFFDYVDPWAYLWDLELGRAEKATRPAPVRRVPLELRPPPDPLLDPDDPEWLARWAPAREEAERLGIRLAEAGIVPWTRKAHELVLHAAGEGVGEEAHRLCFEAVFQRGLDVGRVDVLVALATELGLNATEAKAVLDVDRYAEAVAAGRAEARVAGARASPALVSPHGTLQGFHNRDALRTFLFR